jgi:hypothetical protein
MNFSLVTELPFWFLLFCVLAGVVYASVLYYKESNLPDVKTSLKLFLAGIRFVVVTILAFLLLSPLLKTAFREVEKPIVVLAQDNSKSIIIGKDSTFYKSEYQASIKRFVEKLSTKYDVHTLSFGDKISDNPDIKYTEGQTNFAELFEEIDSRYSNRNLGALVICSDGIFNKGEDPVNVAQLFKVPVFTVALGDTTIKKDVLISKVRHNRMAFFGNTFPLEITLEAHHFSGKSAQLTIQNNSEILVNQPVLFTDNNFSKTIPVQLSAKAKGIQRYTVKIAASPGELTYHNNVQEVFIEVLDGKEKVLLLAAAPHPDIAAIKQAIESNENYELELAYASDFSGSTSGYNLVILHQLPNVTIPFTKLNQLITAEQVPLFFILGNQSNLPVFSALNMGLSLIESRGNPNEVEALPAENFSLFTLSDKTRSFISQLPPLLAPYGNYKTSNSSTVLLKQKIGTVSSDFPLLLFNDIASRKIGILTGEGIWRWRLADFEQHHSHEIFQELMHKTVQYLSVKVDKSLFRVFTKHHLYENEQLEFDAEVYNESYELINQPDVQLEIINSDKKRFPFLFSPASTSYHLSISAFPAGDYTYEAKVKVGEKTLTQRGTFTISPLVIEAINTTADHQLMYNLAAKHEGKMYLPTQLDALQNQLLQHEQIKPVSYTEVKFKELIHLKWVFFLLLSLLSFEWFLRKRNGGY